MDGDDPPGKRRPDLQIRFDFFTGQVDVGDHVQRSQATNSNPGNVTLSTSGRSNSGRSVARRTRGST